MTPGTTRTADTPHKIRGYAPAFVVVWEGAHSPRASRRPDARLMRERLYTLLEDVLVQVHCTLEGACTSLFRLDPCRRLWEEMERQEEEESGHEKTTGSVVEECGGLRVVVHRMPRRLVQIIIATFTERQRCRAFPTLEVRWPGQLFQQKNVADK
jgi:hypothetical protein